MSCHLTNCKYVDRHTNHTGSNDYKCKNGVMCDNAMLLTSETYCHIKAFHPEIVISPMENQSTSFIPDDNTPVSDQFLDILKNMVAYNQTAFLMAFSKLELTIPHNLNALTNYKPKHDGCPHFTLLKYPQMDSTQKVFGGHVCLRPVSEGKTLCKIHDV